MTPDEEEKLKALSARWHAGVKSKMREAATCKGERPAHVKRLRREAAIQVSMAAQLDDLIVEMMTPEADRPVRHPVKIPGQP